MGATHLIVFAKAPVPGQVKTRLIGAIGEVAAARLATRMLDNALEQALAAGVGSVELCGVPAQEPLLQAAAARFGVALTAQSEGDLGTRMASAFQRTLPGRERVVLIGTDCPGLDAAALREAAERLAAPMDAVFRPALDGGYVLVGLRRFAPGVFEGIAWSTPQVMAATRAHLSGLGWRWWEGEPLADVDEPADLARLPASWRLWLSASR